jgi:AhpD family alkylhydroperoxidase
VPCCADAVSSAKPGSSEGSDVDKIKAKFVDFLSSASSPHGLDAYTKQAMAIALSVATRCEPCLKMHLKKAKEKGFTQAEIDEAAWMGISFGGSPTMVFYEQNKNS